VPFFIAERSVIRSNQLLRRELIAANISRQASLEMMFIEQARGVADVRNLVAIGRM
jgi:hypothetical protein